MNDDTLISFGGAVKALGNGKLGGYLVTFTGATDPDLVGEYFTKATDFWLDGETNPTRRVIYHHGFDKTLELRKLGLARLKLDAVGIWAEAQMDLRDEYERRIDEMARDGKLGWSSGSTPHLVRTKRVGNAKEILSWPITEATLTPTPAEFRAKVVSLKSLKVMSEVDDVGEPDTVKCHGGKITVGDHVRIPGTKAGMCGTVKSLHTDGKHPAAEEIGESAAEEANEIEATEESPVARVHLHDAAHKRTGAVKSYPVKDLQAMDDDDGDEAAKSLQQHGVVPAPFLEHSHEVVSAVGGFVERVRGRLDARVKAGRELSAANRSEIDTVCSALESGVERLRAILDRTAPMASDTSGAEAGKSIDPMAVLRLRAEMLSIDQFLSEHTPA